MSFYHSYIILSSWSHSVVLMIFYHSNIISSSWSHSIVLMSFYRSKVIQLTRGCFGPVYWNKDVSSLTRGCSNIQVKNNPVLSFVWLFFEFHQSDIIISFWCHFIILISFHHPEVISLFWCHSILLKSFNWHGVVLDLCIGTKMCQVWLGVVPIYRSKTTPC